ncbi:arginase family protein [Flavobacterium soyangense]|uniref:Arginase family protein n=1 Tax=Flavobacterium soyangense TaxID=2023265 RepID=A0A930UC96_9FLAO|nr:arginase family protein [Flavobacterium soyangense]MBF2709537.1 arginase family protein [Flavobacterium soyangense]
MIFINPQWQGSGLTDDLKFGAETFKSYFKNFNTTVIPLSIKDLATIDNIKCFEPILEQTNFFKEILTDSKLNKISTIGGDCGIEIVPISYLNKIYEEDICVIWIDAHADLNTPNSSPSKTFHGMPLRILLGEGNEKFINLLFSTIKPEQVCFVGLRDIDEPESEYILKHHIPTVTNCQFVDIQNKIKNFKNVYIHLDLDVLDKSEFEFTMFPTNNGFLVADVVQLIEKIKAKHNVVGFCVTESTATTLEQLDKIKSILDQIEL